MRVLVLLLLYISQFLDQVWRWFYSQEGCTNTHTHTASTNDRSIPTVEQCFCRHHIHTDSTHISVDNMNGLALLFLASKSVSKLASRFYMHTHTITRVSLWWLMYSSAPILQRCQMPSSTCTLFTGQLDITINQPCNKPSWLVKHAVALCIHLCYGMCCITK